jgi:hypothetical protein
LPIASTDDELDRRSHGAECDAKMCEHLGRDAFAPVDQAEKQMLGPDVVVVEPPRLLLRELQDFARRLGEFVKAIGHDPSK